MTRAGQRNPVSTLLTCSLCLAQLASAASVEIAPRLSDEEFLRSFKALPPSVAEKDSPPPLPNIDELKKAALEDANEKRLSDLPRSLDALRAGLERIANEIPSSSERIEAQFNVALRALSQFSSEIASGSESRAMRALPKTQAIIVRMEELRSELFLVPETD